MKPTVVTDSSREPASEMDAPVDDGADAAGDDAPVVGEDASVVGDESVAVTDEPEPEGFGSKGWILVGAVVVCFLVIPGVIYLRPTAPAQLGWTFFATFLVLPFIPALILGLIAVWSMTAATE